MDPKTIEIDARASRLRRVGRLARRRMRIDGTALTNGVHTDGTLTVEINGLGSPVAGVPDSFEWEADRPVALVIVRSGIDGEDVAFQVGPSQFGMGRSAMIGDGTGIQYVAFCYDAAPSAMAVVGTPAPAPSTAPATVPVAAASGQESPPRRRIAATRSLAPSGRDRRSILDQILRGSSVRRATI
jgi:hypothetical protein